MTVGRGARLRDLLDAHRRRDLRLHHRQHHDGSRSARLSLDAQREAAGVTSLRGRAARSSSATSSLSTGLLVGRCASQGVLRPHGPHPGRPAVEDLEWNVNGVAHTDPTAEPPDEAATRERKRQAGPVRGGRFLARPLTAWTPSLISPSNPLLVPISHTGLHGPPRLPGVAAVQGARVLQALLQHALGARREGDPQRPRPRAAAGGAPP